MHLSHLCLILPSDHEESDQLVPSHSTPQANQYTKIKEFKSKKHVFSFLHSSLSKFCQHGITITKINHKKSSYVFHDIDGVQLYSNIGSDNPRIFSYAELYIGSRGFSQDEVLGSGGFGKVYKTLLPSDGTLVAVKCCLAKGQQFDKTFASELVAVAHLRHKNLVKLKGWCVHEDQLYLVYEYMPNLSLDKILFKSAKKLKEEPLGWLRRLKIVKGLAAGLYYLHEQLETQIIHRDVKTSNVMLDSHYNAKLGDFGLARLLEHEIETAKFGNNFKLGETTRIGGTIGYLPPESFNRKTIATSKSDVFSFGIVLLEVVSGRRAIDLTYPDDKIILLDWIRRLYDEKTLVMDIIDPRLQNGSCKVFFEMKHVIHLGLLCTLHDPQSRPSMKWIVEALVDTSSKLPSLPSFHSHPMYISLSSSLETSPYSTKGTMNTSTSTSTITNYTSSNYVTAKGETIYVTSEAEHRISSTKIMHHKPSFPKVETPHEISYKEIASATENFCVSRKVAELDFGTAYHGILDEHHHVTVKRLGMKTCPALRDRFCNELRNLGRLRHRNLVQLRGWCTEQGEMLVVYDYDYSSRKFLSHILHNHHNNSTKNVLKWHHRYNIVKSLASALLYLHEEWDEQVIHRNITSSAIILEHDMNPRLGSFALAEFLSRNEEHGGHHHVDAKKSVCGIFGYMAPEYVESGEATSYADVYSFGVVVLEVVSGHNAVDFKQPEVLLVKKVHEFEMRNRPLEELVDRRLNGEYDYMEMMRLVRLGIACTRSDPKVRPSTRQIVSILDGNDKLIMGENIKEGREEWRERNACSLSLVRRIQALGIQ